MLAEAAGEGRPCSRSGEKIRARVRMVAPRSVGWAPSRHTGSRGVLARRASGPYISPMDQAVSPQAIEAATGTSWEEWLSRLESVDARSMSHKEIVEVAAGFGAPPWWRQMITVSYEHHIGRRVPGQRSDGSFSISASKTLPVSMDGALARWVAAVGSPTEILGVAVERGPEMSETVKWRYWRCTLADGSRVVVNISRKAPEKSVVSVQHEGLESEDLGEHWRSHWRAELQRL